MFFPLNCFRLFLVQIGVGVRGFGSFGCQLKGCRFRRAHNEYTYPTNTNYSDRRNSVNLNQYLNIHHIWDCHYMIKLDPDVKSSRDDSCILFGRRHIQIGIHPRFLGLKLRGCWHY